MHPFKRASTGEPAAFFSYSREDSEFVLRVARDLKAAGANVWLDQMDIVPGERWDGAIERALADCPRMLVVLSPAAVHSTNVMDEVSFALEEGKTVVPILYRDCAIPFRLRRVQYIDLRFDYSHGLTELLKILAAQHHDLGGTTPAADHGDAAEHVAQAPQEDHKPLEKAQSRMRLESQTLPTEHAPSVSSAPPESSRPQRTLALEEVQLGASTPRNVCPGEEFVARFAAYTKSHRTEVHRVISQEAPSAHLRLDLEKCRWRRGAKVVVRLDAKYVEVSNPVQAFKWNGACCVLRFDAKVQDDAPARTVILRFDVAVEGFPVVAIRPEIAVSKRDKDEKRATSPSLIEQAAPKSAFASYAKKDRRDVLGRVRSLQILALLVTQRDGLGMGWVGVANSLRRKIHFRNSTPPIGAFRTRPTSAGTVGPPVRCHV